MKTISYEALDPVLRTWDDARFRSKNFNEEFGTNCLDKMFELHPSSKQVFGYGEHDVVSRKMAGVHGRLFASVFDSIFQMLGPDVEFVEEMLAQVGRRHRIMGIHPSLFPFMGDALIYAVEQSLGRTMTSREIGGWQQVYDAVSSELVRHILGED